MDARELRIGNWVAYREPHRWQQVSNIGCYPLCLDDNADALIEDIQPIPLSPELLEKAGLKMEVYGHNGDRDVAIAIVPSTDMHVTDEMVVWVSNEPVPHIKYLHQLQNLFYDICGEELKIEL